MSNKKRIAKRLKTDKRSEQIICDVYATTAIVKSKTLGTIHLDETMLKRLAWIVDKAASIQQGWKLDQKITKSEKTSNPLPLSLADYRSRTEGATIAGYGYDIYLGNMIKELNLEPSRENLMQIIKVLGEDSFQEFMKQFSDKEDVKDD